MTEPLTYSLEDAAKKLGGTFTVGFLRHNLKRLPHIRSNTGRGRGGRIGFTDAQLRQIVAMHIVEPAAPISDEQASIVTRRRSA